MERDQAGKLRRHGATAVSFLAGIMLLALFSCRAPERSFGALLARIDSAPELAEDRLYLNAAALAESTQDRLRLLKRASRRSPGLYAANASAMLASGTVSEPVALAALDAFLSAGRYGQALALFDSQLNYRTRPAEYAEALSLAIVSGIKVHPPLDRLVACAGATGDSRFLVYAAVEAMLSGDRSSALMLLDDVTLSNPAAAAFLDYRLLWDVGAIRALGERSANPLDPLELAVHADAERARGEYAAASASYASIIERYPAWSWKPYAALARMLADEADKPLQPWPYAPYPDSTVAGSAPGLVEGRLFNAMRERFPDSTEALLERARWLWSRGRSGEALALTDSLGGEAAAILSLVYESAMERAEPEALRLAALYPASPGAADAALAALARAGSWKRFSELYARMRDEGLKPRRSWFWGALDLVLAGDTGPAVEQLRQGQVSAPDYVGSFDIGLLELAAGLHEQAAQDFLRAAYLARNVTEAADAYVFAGDALLGAGRVDQAKKAYEAAISVDPACRDARSRLSRLNQNG